MYRIIGILIIFILLGCKGKNENTADLTVEEELGRKIKINRNYAFGAIQTNEFSYDAGAPFQVFYKKGNIWLIDRDKQALVKLDKNGNVVNTYGKRGGGPNENQRIKDAYVGSDWYGVVDNAKDIFKYVSLETDTTIRYYEFYDHIDRGIFLNDSLLAITNAENNDLIINLVDHFGNIKKKISLKDKLGYTSQSIDLVYEGEFTRANKNGLFCYFAYRHSFFIVINQQGDVKYMGKTIDKMPPPKPSFTTVGEFTMHGVEPDVMVNLQANIDIRHFYVLSNVIEKENTAKYRAIDVYDVADGRYAFSIKVPLLKDGQVPVAFDIEGERMVVLYENFSIAEYIMPAAL